MATLGEGQRLRIIFVPSNRVRSISLYLWKCPIQAPSCQVKWVTGPLPRMSLVIGGRKWQRDLSGILGGCVCLQLEERLLFSLSFSFCTPTVKAPLSQPTRSLFQGPLPCCPRSCFLPLWFYFLECEKYLATRVFFFFFLLFWNAQVLMFLSNKENQEINGSPLSQQFSQCHTNMEWELLNSRPIRDYLICIQHQNLPEILATWA